MAVVDTGMLATLLLAACRSIAKVQDSSIYYTTALQYKIRTISSINEALLREGPIISNITIAKSLALASKAVSIPEYVRIIASANRFSALVADRRL